MYYFFYGIHFICREPYQETLNLANQEYGAGGNRPKNIFAEPPSDEYVMKMVIMSGTGERYF